MLIVCFLGVIAFFFFFFFGKQTSFHNFVNVKSRIIKFK